MLRLWLSVDEAPAATHHSSRLWRCRNQALQEALTHAAPAHAACTSGCARLTNTLRAGVNGLGWRMAAPLRVELLLAPCACSAEGKAQLNCPCGASPDSASESAGLWLRQDPKLTATRAWRRTSMAADIVRTVRRHNRRARKRTPGLDKLECGCPISENFYADLLPCTSL